MVRVLQNLFILLLFVSAGTTLSGAVDPARINYGLTFRSHSYNQDARTGLDLSPGGNLSFRGGFTLEFDLKLGGDQGFGYIFRIISDDDSSLDMTANVNNGRMNLILTEGHNTIENLNIGGNVPLRQDEWMHVAVTVDREGVEYSMDGAVFDMDHTFRDFDDIKIYFGHNRHVRYHTTDVPPMTVRNVSIHSGGGLMHWKLSEHAGDVVFDDIHRRPAGVENGVWEIDKHTRWNRLATLKLRDKNPQIAYDESGARIFIATLDSVCIYNLGPGTLDRLPVYGEGGPFRSGGSHMIYDPKRDKLISYSVLFDELVEYDFSSNRWSNRLSEYLPPIQQHSRYVDPENRRLVVFGGYGNHIYNGALAVHSLDGGGWKIDSLSRMIPPRYLSAMGYRGDGNLLVMGGYGSDSGKQEESSRNMYDLYDIDIDSLTCRHLASFSPDGEALAMGGSLVIDEANELVYTLAFNNDRFHSGLMLMSLNLRDNTLTRYGDTIPYRFLDTDSYADLIFRPRESVLYAVVLQASDNFTNDVEIWSLSFPPIDVLQVRQRSGLAAADLRTVLLTVLAATALGGVAVYLLRRSKKRRKRAAAIPDTGGDIPVRERQVSTISMLGGLQIFDAGGEDITAGMSPVVRQIFLLILMNSAEEGKGITSQRLNETFWLGMDNTSASNNRNVNIRKLRLLLQRIGDVTVSHSNEYWYIRFGSGVRCDYLEVVSLLGKISRKTAPDRQMLVRLLTLASRGLLLPNTNYEWMDRYKAEYSDRLMDVLLKTARDPAIGQDDELMLHIARTILLHDVIDEDAIRIQCRILYRKGQKGQSKQAFDKFCEEYMRLLNTMPDLVYDDIISTK